MSPYPNEEEADLDSANVCLRVTPEILSVSKNGEWGCYCGRRTCNAKSVRRITEIFHQFEFNGRLDKQLYHSFYIAELTRQLRHLLPRLR